MELKKFFVVFTLSLFMLLISIFSLFISEIQSEFKNHVTFHIKRDMYDISQYVREYTSQDRLESILRYTDLKLLTSKHLKSIYVFDEDNIIFSSTREYKIDNLKKLKSIELKELNSQLLDSYRYTHIVVDVFKNGEIRHLTVAVEIDMEYINNILFKDVSQQIGITIIALLIIFISSYFLFNKYITTPIDNIVNFLSTHKKSYLFEDDFFFHDLKKIRDAIDQFEITIKRGEEEMKEHLLIIDKYIPILTLDKIGNLLTLNRAFQELTGYSQELFPSENLTLKKHEDEVTLEKALGGGLITSVWSGDIDVVSKDGEKIFLDGFITPKFKSENLSVESYTLIARDITDKKRLEILSITDELTTIYNRRFFNSVLDNELNRTRRGDEFIALMILDVDFFKKYNDNYGHQAGDTVLREIGVTLGHLCKRSSDFAFRLGGEEFGVIVSNQSHSGVYKFAEVIRKSIENLHIEHSQNSASKYVSVSVGVVVGRSRDFKSSSSLYSVADKALYRAKESGRNRVELVDNIDKEEVDS